MKRILVVEDDKILNQTLTYNLKNAGYEVDWALSAKQAEERARRQSYDLVVLDVNLPDGDGYQVCGEIKEIQETAVIFLTANDMESDMLRGYEVGADDYVTKPFSIAVFQKKIEAMLNRFGKQSAGDGYRDGWLEVDFSELRLSAGGRLVFLSPKEWKLLRIFLKNKGQLLTRRHLLEKLWDNEGDFIDDHTLTTTLSGLRKKIERKEHTYIQTVYGMGYMWVSEGEV